MPLTSKGNKIMSAMKAEYGDKRGERVFYASRNKGTISGVERGRADGGGIDNFTQDESGDWRYAPPKEKSDFGLTPSQRVYQGFHSGSGRGGSTDSDSGYLRLATGLIRKAVREGHARGGLVDGYDYGGAVNPTQAVPPVRPPMPGGMGMPGSGGQPMGMAGLGGYGTPGINFGAGVGGMGQGMPPYAPGMQSGGGLSFADRWQPVADSPSAYGEGRAYGMQGRTVGEILQEGHDREMLRRRYKPLPSGGVGMQFGGTPSWVARREAIGLTHTGPIPSIVPGRTDRHNMRVPSGSYVLPADHVSSLGQGNTQAGYAILNRMFHGGPFGMAGPKMGRGMGLPKPPKLQPVMTSKGGARTDHHVGAPVDVVTAGGEYVVPPHIVAQIGGGNVDNGHKILDAWVKKHREKHIKTLRNLPGPAKT